ncbi:hypothetical protein GWO13_04065 [Candidatus Bathyarchaeota archaeon]|nr:hypothetical protein [Candidatus Bathyarchaeota archaeon]
MRSRRILATIVGGIQGAIGVLAVTFAYTLYMDYLDLRAWLNVTAEFLPLYMFILIVFGFFSIISGLFLLTERRLPQTESGNS